MAEKDKIKKVVYSPVVAELFHYGILQSLKFANAQGEYHVCGILTDKAARYYKKNLLSNLKERKHIISSLNFIDRVMVQDSKDPTKNLKKIHEEFKNAQIILVHGDDWRRIPGTEYIEKSGGKVVRHPYYTKLSDYKIINGLLQRYKGKFKSFNEFARHFQFKDFTYFNPKKIEGQFFSSKADTLRDIQPLLKKSRVEKTIVFTVLDWKEEKNKIINKIRKIFSPNLIVVRSSALKEDAFESSMAGYFHSELNVPSSEPKRIKLAVEKVIGSYNNKKSNFMINQILVQPQVIDVMMSGVIFTRTPEKNLPYYIINYDDRSGSTESVTKGIENKTIRISRFCDPKEYPEQMKGLLESVKEIEAIVPNTSLDIEFAINKKKDVIIFQVRPIIANSSDVDDKKIKEKINELKQQFRKLSKRKAHLAGDENCFGDMPDWNPAEIIGDNPNYLDYSLYDYIITDNAWHQARTSQGYTNVNPAKLVVLFGNKPYVNVRNDFNSFIPASVSKKLKEKLVSYYINKLENRPELQDKVEFEVLHTCYDLSFDKRSKELLEAGFSYSEIDELKQSLIGLTNNLIKNSRRTIQEDLSSVFKMKKLRGDAKKIIASTNSIKELLKQAKRLLDDCKINGTAQFSRLARLAFIGNIILKSMVAEGFVDKNFYSTFLNSITTVAKKMNADFTLLSQGKMDEKEFLNLYGHLRPGTYDITSPRYDKNPGLLRNARLQMTDSKAPSTFEIDGKTYDKISDGLKRKGIEVDARELLNFIKSALEARELSKFEFTKSLSDAIELIAEAGRIIGFSREEMAQLGISSLFDLKDGEQNIIIKWSKIVQARKKETELNNNIVLPPIIFSEKDFDVVSYYSARPNFITQKKVDGETISISHFGSENVPQLSGKIVLLENGDPGYDWIFTKNPKGLITKYGGVASHMSIRCAEFGLPAAIGCGEVFDNIKMAHSVILDCQSKKITPFM